MKRPSKSSPGSEPGSPVLATVGSSGLCPECGRPLSTDAPRQLCLHCLINLAALPEAEAAQEVAALSLPRSFGDYELLEEVGRGGMGVVYRARQLSLNRMVAVKILPGAIFGEPQFILRFRDEVQMAAALKHPNIVTIYDVGEHDGQPYFAMEFIEGQTLATLAGQRHLLAGESARLIRRVAEAVHFAHEGGILHRDLKPSNILIDRAGQPHLADFGLAKRLAATADLTVTGQTLGSPNYIPPEQVSTGRGIIGPHSDVYSLGAVLYHLLTGRPPVVADSVHDTLEAVLHDDPLVPRLLNPNVPRDLETICLKCLAKEPSRRYGSARELAEDLGRFLEHHPILARPVSPAERAVKWMRRRPVLASTLGISVASAMVIAVLTANHSAQLRRQRDQAVASERLAARTVVQMEFNSALDQFKKNRSLSGLVQLADIIRRDRQHAGATLRLASALTHRSFNLLAYAPLEHPDAVLDADSSPDGQTLVTACGDGRVRLWNTQTGALLPPRIERPGAIQIVRFSPDGRRVLTAGRDGSICLWSPQTGELIADPITNNAPAEFASFNSDGTLVLAAFSDRTVRVWQVPSGRQLFAPIPHHDAVVVAEFNPAGSTLLTGSRDGRMQSWRSSDGQPVGAVIETFRPLHEAVFNADGSRFASGSGDRRPLIWNSASSKVLKVFDSLSAAVTAVAFSPDGMRLAAGTLDGAWMVADAVGRQRLSRLVNMPAGIQSLAFSPDGERLLVVAGDQTFQLFDSQNGHTISDPTPHPDPVRKARFSPDGTRVISIAGSNACVWEIVRNLSPPLALPHAASVQTVRYSPDGLRLLTGGADGAARLWNAHTGQLLAEPMRHIKNIRIQSARFSADGRKIATASADRTARVWHADSGKPITPMLPHGDMVLNAEFSPDGKRLVTASADDFARIWNLVSGTNDLAPLLHPTDVLWAQFSPNGGKILSACADGRVRLWEAQTGHLLPDGWSHGGAILSACVSPDGRWLITGAEDGTAIIGEANTGQPVGHSLWHPAPVIAAGFSSDARRFFTASSDGMMRLWDTSNHEPVAVPILFARSVTHVGFVPARKFGLAVVDRESIVPWSIEADTTAGESWQHWGSVHDLAFSPDGRFVAAVGENDRALIRELPPATVPGPEWLPALAESLAGSRLDRLGNLHPVSPLDLWRLQQRLSALEGDDEWSRWARWFVSVGDSRTLSPDLPVTRLEFAEVCFRDTSGYLHRGAARWAADQPRALAQLAYDILLLPTRSRHRAEADLLSRLALKRAPLDPEVQRLRREVEQRLARAGN